MLQWCDFGYYSILCYNLQNSITERHSSCDKKIEIMNAVLEYNNYLNNQLNKNFDALKESNRINELTFDGEIANRKNIFNTNFSKGNRYKDGSGKQWDYGYKRQGQSAMARPRPPRAIPRHH